MSSISFAFTLLALITGMSLVGAAIDTTMYSNMPRGRAKWLVGLLIATLVFTFIAVLASGKGCRDYTVSDYKYGEVPVSCKP